MTARHLLLLVAVVSSLALPASGRAESGSLSVVRVYSGWREAASFKRISEYFNGRENTGGEVVLRTQPGERAGYYFLVRLANPAAPLTVTVRLAVITAATAKPVVHTFPLDLPAGETVFHLGLTGTDWADAGANPVAWKIEFIDGAGRVLATEKSYLWEKPAE